MNIPGVKNINISNLTKNIKSFAGMVSAPNTKLSGFLAPLAQDTVSFKGTAKDDTCEDFVSPEITVTSDESRKDIDKMYYGGTGKVAIKLYEDVSPIHKEFKSTLKRVFFKNCDFSFHEAKESVATLKFHQKSVTSIIDKMASRKLKSYAASKERFCDLTRARVVLNTGSSKEASKIWSAVAKAVIGGELKIIAIKNYGEKPRYTYISERSSDQVNEAIIKTSESARTTKERKNSGYTAVHIIVELKDGFKGEIQIMGKNVERVKEIEDIIYKLNKGYCLNKKYDVLKKEYDSLKSKEKEKLEEYIRTVYLDARQKELDGCIDDNFPKLPVSFGLNPFFDFANLYKLFADK